MALSERGSGKGEMSFEVNEGYETEFEGIFIRGFLCIISVVIYK